MSAAGRPNGPRIAALRIPDAAGDRNAAWCPWCETVHCHGEGAGARVAHCHEEAGSPFSTTGYELDVIGTATDKRAAEPPALAGHRPSLKRKLDQSANRLRTELAASVMGVPRSKAFRKNQIANGVRGAAVGAYWYLGRDSETAAGTDLVALGELLHGLPAGVVTVRMLEAATGLDLDARAASEVAEAIEAWVERGRPRGRRGEARPDSGGTLQPRHQHPKTRESDWLSA